MKIPRPLRGRRPAILGVCAAAVITTTMTAGFAGAGPAPAAPAGDGSYFPQTWTNYAGSQDRNAAFALAPGAPGPLRRGVSWQYAEAGALPLNGGPYDEKVLGYLAASVKTTQMLGNSVGVTAIDGQIIAESDSSAVYSLNAVTGHLNWQAPTVNAAMGNPVAGGGLVFAGAGDTGFSFASMLKYAAKEPGATRGMGFSAIYALSQRTGRQAWRYDTAGEDMPSPVYLNGTVYFGNGDGHMYALNAKTGTPRWITAVGGFDSMSSANYWHNPATGQNLILAGFSNPNYLYAFNAATGAVAWKSTIPNVFSTGMGDNSPTVDPATGIVLQDSVINFNPVTRTSDLAIFATSARTGRVLWETRLGAGPSPRAYKSSIAMISNGTAYVGNPANGHLTALSVTTGKILWSTDLGTYNWEGTTYHVQNRGGPTLYRHVLYQAAGAYIFALDPATGTILTRYQAGGRYGIINPVIVGATMYLSNSYNWIQAIPLTTIYPNWAHHTTR